MAALYGRLQGARGEATRVGHQTIKAKLETWDGSVEVELEKDGTFTVRVGDKSYPRIEVATGNVNNRTWLAIPSSIHWEQAAKDARLGVDHDWTNVRCPAYRSLDGRDCNCGQVAI